MKKSEIYQILSIVQWIILIGLWIAIPRWWGCLFAIVMFTIHTIEAIMYGIPLGKKKNYTTLESLSLTWLYGFTWWKYLENYRDKGDKSNE